MNHHPHQTLPNLEKERGIPHPKSVRYATRQKMNHPSVYPKNELCHEDPDFFSWDDEPKIIDKSDPEKFIDELWADFDFFHVFDEHWRLQR